MEFGAIARESQETHKPPTDLVKNPILTLYQLLWPSQYLAKKLCSPGLLSMHSFILVHIHSPEGR